MDKTHILKRADKLRALMSSKGADAFVVITEEGYSWESLYYLSGFRGTSGALLVYGDSVELILDGRYTKQGGEQSPYAVRTQDLGLAEDIIESLSAHGAVEILCEASKTSHAAWEKLSFDPKKKWSDGTSVISELRRSKDEVEAGYMRKAADIAAAAFLKTLGETSSGMSEKEFEALLNFNIVKFNGETGFDMIVASGTRSSMPHGRATEKIMERGEWVTVDFGVRHRGYFCDITRNFSLGKADSRAFEYHEILAEAHSAAVKALMPGAIGSEVYNVARDVLQKNGLAEYFTHGLGHGLGIEVHETPYLSPRYDRSLKCGDVVTVEPGIYFDGWGGLRLEDNYLIIDGGVKRLTMSLEQSFFRL